MPIRGAEPIADERLVTAPTAAWSRLWVNNAPSTTFPGNLGNLNGARFIGDGTINSLGTRMDFNF